MVLFKSIGKRHLNGHKDLTLDKEVVSLETKKVYFPTLSPNGKPITCLVNPGDKVKVGQKIMERTDFYVPIYASVSGTVLENENIFHPVIGRDIPHLVIENDGKYTKAEPLKTVSLDSSNEEIFAALKEAGLVGMGGAGFPTYIKYQGQSNIDTIIVNAVECEPFLTTDYEESKAHADELLTGLRLMMRICNAKKAVIAFKVHKHKAVEAVKAQIKEDNIEVREVKDLYPMGWERTLIKVITKKDYDKLPSEIGVIVNNVQTLINIGRTLSTGEVIVERVVTVSGDAINEPMNIKVRIGTLASELIERAGGLKDLEEVALIPGGPMCSKAVKTSKYAILIPSGSITCLEYKKLPEEPCLRCGACTQYCPSGLQPVEIRAAHKAKDTERVIKLGVMNCVECGMCSYTCPSKIELTDTMRLAKVVARAKMAMRK